MNNDSPNSMENGVGQMLAIAAVDLFKVYFDHFRRFGVNLADVDMYYRQELFLVLQVPIHTCMYFTSISLRGRQRQVFHQLQS